MPKAIATAFWRRLDVPGRDAARVTETQTGYELFGQATFLDATGVGPPFVIRSHFLRHPTPLSCSAKDLAKG